MKAANRPVPGNLRSVGLALLLMLGLSAAYGAVWLGATVGLNALVYHLIGVWGVTSANLYLAPAWLQALYPNLFSLADLLISAALLLLTFAAARILLKDHVPSEEKKGRNALGGLGLGLLCAAIPIIVLYLSDSIRFDTSFNRPMVGLQTLISALDVLAFALAWEFFFRGLLLRYSRDRLRIAYAVAAILMLEVSLSALMGARGYTLVNIAAMGLMMCLIARNSGGMWRNSAFRFGFTALDLAVFGASGNRFAVRSVYGAYTVSEEWLSGVAEGLMNGAFSTILFAAVIAVIWLRRRRR